MFCTQCGKEISDSSMFCCYCGAHVEPLETASGKLGSGDDVEGADDLDGASRLDDAGSGERPAGAGGGSAADLAAMEARRGLAQAAAASGAASAASKPAARNMAPLIAIAAVLVAALVIIFGMASGSGGGGAAGGGNGPASTDANGTPTVSVDGTQVTAIQRPSFLTAAEAHADEGTAVTAAVTPFTVQQDLGNVWYVDEMLPLSSSASAQQARQMLAKNGFLVVENGNSEFFEAYESNRYSLLPSFVTVDSMMHTYHLYFSHLLKNTERSYLAPALAQVSRDMMQESEQQLKQLEGTEWEDAAKRNVAFFAVGASLLDPSTQVPASVADVVSKELALVAATGGVTESPLLAGTDFPTMDYSQYIVRGYYVGDPTLEAYFRAMMWYGQVNFAQKSEDLDRSALLMTIAQNGTAHDGWESIYTITSFFAGTSDDLTYYEYYPLFTAVYGEGASVADLPGDADAFNRYRALASQMRAPAVNSVVVLDEGAGDGHQEQVKGYRFMGQRFTIDAAIMQRLVYSQVGANAQGKNRMLPNALDVPAAMGSEEALAILEDKGETSYSGYSENLAKMRQDMTAVGDDLWNASLYSRWLYTLNPLLEKKGEGWPQFMQSSEWARKNLQSYLGSYTELKHDTVLYGKQVMVEMGGGGMPEHDDRGYVEPEPDVYRRLATLIAATSDGLSSYGMLGADDAQNLKLLYDLATQLQAISNKELQEEALTDEDYELIRTYGGQIEHFWKEVYQNEAQGAALKALNFPAAIVTDIATDPNGNVLELGTGRAAFLYVIVSIDGQPRLMRGSVFDFYQFTWPLSDRLTDTSWRDMMGFSPGASATGSTSIETESWTDSFQLESTYY